MEKTTYGFFYNRCIELLNKLEEFKDDREKSKALMEILETNQKCLKIICDKENTKYPFDNLKNYYH